MGSHCSFEHLKHKLWLKERLRVKLPNQKNSKIDPKYLVVEGVQHTVGKLLMKTTTSL
jgi:hypothetical protein